MTLLIAERNKLLSDKVYLRSRVKDAEAQMRRLERELQLLRGFILRDAGERINGGGGAAVQLWNASTIAGMEGAAASAASANANAHANANANATPSANTGGGSGSSAPGSGSGANAAPAASAAVAAVAAANSASAAARLRSKEKQRKKKVAVLGDAEAEHLLLAAKTLRQKERRAQVVEAARALEEEEEIRRAVAAAAMPPLPIKPRGSRKARRASRAEGDDSLGAAEGERDEAEGDLSFSAPSTPAQVARSQFAQSLMDPLTRTAPRLPPAPASATAAGADERRAAAGAQMRSGGGPRTPPPPSRTSASVKLGSALPQTPSQSSSALLGAVTGSGVGAAPASPQPMRQAHLSSARGGESDDERGHLQTPGGSFRSSGMDGLLQAAQLLTPGGSRIARTAGAGAGTTPRSSRPIRPEHDEYYPKGVDAGFGGTLLATGGGASAASWSPTKRRRVNSASGIRFGAGDDELDEESSGTAADRPPRQRTKTAPERTFGDDAAPGASQLSALDLLADQAAASQHPSQNSDWSNSGAEEEQQQQQSAQQPQQQQSQRSGSRASSHKRGPSSASAASRHGEDDLRAPPRTPGSASSPFVAFSSPLPPPTASTETSPHFGASGAGADANQGSYSPTRPALKTKLKPGAEVPKEKRVPYIRWTDPEDRKLRAAIKEYGQR